MTLNAQWLQNVAYPARVDRQAFGALWDEGVFSTLDFKVTPRALGENMSVDVAVGRAVVEGDDQDFQGSYLVTNDALLNKPVGFAPGALSRYDLVVLRVYDTNASMTAPGDYATVEVIAGVVDAAPVVPDVPDTAIPLAVIGPIDPGTVLIDDSLISYAPLLLAGERKRPGSVELYAGTIAPNGWVFMFGQDATPYPALVDLGYTVIPDMRDRVPVGRGDMGGVDVGLIAADTTDVGDSGGAATVTLSSAEMPSHTHTQDAHTHTQDAHSHVQNAHNHTQDAHDHPQDAHSHGISFVSGAEDVPHTHPASSQGFAISDATGAGLQTSAGDVTGYTVPNVASATGDAFPSTSHTHDVNGNTQDTTANNQATTATNQATTATNQNTTATNQASTATNQATGGGGAHNNLQPYTVLNYIMRAAA